MAGPNIFSASFRLALVCGCLLPTQVHAQRMVALVHARIETASKAGTIEDGTLLIKDGKVEAVGTDVPIPVAAQIVDLSGKTVLPGLVDPYYVVPIGRNVEAAPVRTIVFNGRVFRIGGGTPAIATTFARVADGLDIKEQDWRPALRSGITSLHLVTGGFAQSAIATVSEGATSPTVTITQPDGMLVTTVTNNTKTLAILRGGLKKESSKAEASANGGPTSQRLAAMRSRGGRGIPTSSGRGPTSGSTSSPAAKKDDPLDGLWDKVREGNATVFVNANNPSAILHVKEIIPEDSDAQVALVASGSDVFLNLDSLPAKHFTPILPPRIDQRPNSQYRINVPAMLAEKQIEFALSLSLGQSDFRAMQHNPLFSVGMLIRAGLDRELALKSITLVPAKLLGIDKQVGSLEAGKSANLVVFDGDPFAATSEVEQVYVSGEPVHEK